MYLLQAWKTSFTNMSIHIRWFATDDNKPPNGPIYELSGHAWWAINNKNIEIGIGYQNGHWTNFSTWGGCLSNLYYTTK
jgi:hypothetical protein